MCGIVGVLSQRDTFSVDKAEMEKMLGVIHHRGPDQAGIYVYKDETIEIGLGSVRLSIIDIEGGQQPIGNEDNTIWVVFNGEIYNYVNLRKKLSEQGHKFSSNSDTEVLVHLYEEFGYSCIKYIEGQFAFAIWDEKTSTLFLGRDKFGIRPLYFTNLEKGIVFGSEIKSILSHKNVESQLDSHALDQVFTYWSTISPYSIFQNVQSLKPAHYLICRPNTPPEIIKYWDISFSTDTTAHKMTLEDAAVELKELLTNATKARLQADVPVGAYLSGGLDSSSIVALAQELTGNQVQTFSLAFEDTNYDESQFQEEIVRTLGSEHRNISCRAEDIGNIFPDVIRHVETPILRTAPAPMFMLSKLVNDNGIKVVLTGEGADEFLAGYNIFKEASIRHFWSRVPASELRPLLLRRLYPYIPGLSSISYPFLKKFFGHRLKESALPEYSHIIRWSKTSRIKRFYSKRFLENLTSQNLKLNSLVHLPEEFQKWTALSRAQYLEISIFLSEYLLSSQGDRVAMAHSVEGRFPFLDEHVIKFCNMLPTHFKLYGLNEKHILKRAMHTAIPTQVINRKKQPYRAPGAACFFPNGKSLDWVEELLSPEKIDATGYFDSQKIHLLTNKLCRFGHLSEIEEMALIGMLSTQLVHHLFVDCAIAYHPINSPKMKYVSRTKHI